ncbi:SIS domain-containing protein [Erwinia sp. MYb416]|uniref:SIS domain-containing protein n=1 Tax=Erwinia sp. MYb416 TaxID=3108532 RepID=UPI0030A4A110
MSATILSDYEKDIEQQVEALRDQLAYQLPQALSALDLNHYDRIVLAGMGSSDYALIPIERELIERGYPVWRIDAGRLLDMPNLVTANSLLWLTSQSGMSGEVVALLNSITPPKTLIGITNDTASELAKKAQVQVLLHSGSEATVSAKSYLNTLVASYRVLYALTGRNEKPLLATVHAILPDIAQIIRQRAEAQALSDALLAHNLPRVAMIGIGADAATALTGALITKEASKVAAEGFIGGQFRHGPMETSGAGMLALLFGDGSDNTLNTLAADLRQNGTLVVSVGPEKYADSVHLPTPTEPLPRLLCAMLWVQHLTVTLARGNGRIPGEFLYGQKITVKT